MANVHKMLNFPDTETGKKALKIFESIPKGTRSMRIVDFLLSLESEIPVTSASKSTVSLSDDSIDKLAKAIISGFVNTNPASNKGR